MGSILAYFTSGISSDDKETTRFFEELSSYLSPVIFDIKTGQHLKFHSVLLSFMFFSMLYIAVNLLILLVTMPLCRKLTQEMEVIWTQTVVHVIFSSIMSPVSIWYLLTTNNTFMKDVSNCVTNESTFLMCVTVGFMVHEITTTLTTNWNLRCKNYSMLYQDLVMMFGSCLFLHYDRAHFFGLMAIAVEGIYIFNSITWMLVRFGLFGTLVWKSMQVTTIYMCNYCTLLGVYCLLLLYHQFNAFLDSLPIPVLLLLCTCLIIELFLVIPNWSIGLMEVLQARRVKVVKISSGIYRLSTECQFSSGTRKTQ